MLGIKIDAFHEESSLIDDKIFLHQDVMVDIFNIILMESNYYVVKEEI